MPMSTLERNELRACVAGQADQLLFATACGPQLYGFPCHARYVDLRSVHVGSPLESSVTETREWREQRATVQVEWVSHEVGKFVRLLQVNNGSAYEQLFSPYEVYETEALGELRELGRAMVSLGLFEHYRTTFGRQLALFRGQRDRHGRHMLYLFRMALTGLHLAERGQILADLPTLARFHERIAVLELLDELAHSCDVREPAPYMRELESLARQLAGVRNAARLPERVPHHDRAEAWLARVRASR